ncbi:MAG: hypothetical protein NZ742_07730 [Acidobacteria bacterium]|nr:hypothetical protein [Acidobacteriota bacterium]MDW7984247.1 hypothetical protein [Acidobacteriota bacterium]
MNGETTELGARLSAIEAELRDIRELLEMIIDALGELRRDEWDGYIEGVSEGYRRLYELAYKWSLVPPPRDS